MQTTIRFVRDAGLGMHVGYNITSLRPDSGIMGDKFELLRQYMESDYARTSIQLKPPRRKTCNQGDPDTEDHQRVASFEVMCIEAEFDDDLQSPPDDVLLGALFGDIFTFQVTGKKKIEVYPQSLVVQLQRDFVNVTYAQDGDVVVESDPACAGASARAWCKYLIARHGLEGDVEDLIERVRVESKVEGVTRAIILFSERANVDGGPPATIQQVGVSEEVVDGKLRATVSPVEPEYLDLYLGFCE
jgi:hypothetical protein